MTKLLFIITVFLFLQQISKAAETKYLFYSVNKEVYRVNGNKKEKAIRGMFLTVEQSIIISPLSEIMLVQNDGKSMLLEKPGTYTYSQIKKIFGSAKSGGMSKFFSYVFEKFLAGDDDGDKQKVSAAVFRGRNVMTNPDDSSFIFSSAILFKWNPEQKNIPYKLKIWCNGILFDTVIKNKSDFLLTEKRFIRSYPVFIKWIVLPTDNKQKEPTPFVHLLPLKKDMAAIKQQLKQIALSYSKNKQLHDLMKKDLLEKWLLEYKLL